MSDKWSRKPDKSSRKSDEGRVVDACAEAKDLLTEIAKPAMPGEGVKAMLNRIVDLTGIPYGRVRGLRYGSVKVSGDELKHLKNIKERSRQSAREEQEHAARAEYAKLTAELKRIEDRILALRPDLDCHQDNAGVEDDSSQDRPLD